MSRYVSVTREHYRKNGPPWDGPMEIIGEPCFFCNTRVEPGDVGIYWIGSVPFRREDVTPGSVMVHLHPDCAEKLAIHLIGDARDARKLTRQRRRGLRGDA